MVGTVSFYRKHFEVALLQPDDEYYDLGPWWIGPIGDDPLNLVKYGSLNEIIEALREQG